MGGLGFVDRAIEIAAERDGGPVWASASLVRELQPMMRPVLSAIMAMNGNFFMIFGVI